MLDLARKRADGDRSIRDAKNAAACIGRNRPSECLAFALRKPSWPAVMCDRLDEAGHMTASDPITEAQDLAGRRPSTYACRTLNSAAHRDVIEPRATIAPVTAAAMASDLSLLSLMASSTKTEILVWITQRCRITRAHAGHGNSNRRCTYCTVKIVFGIIPCTPFVPSTTWVMW